MRRSGIATVAAAVLAIGGIGSMGCKTRGDITADPVPSARAAAPASASAIAKLRLKDAPAEGDVADAVRAALAQAGERRRVVVYVGASWCEPCQRFHHAAQQGELDATFPDVDFLVFDLDRDKERLVSAGYVSKLIPLFALPGPDGRASGKQVEGGIKGDGAVGFIAPRLKKMLEE